MSNCCCLCLCILLSLLCSGAARADIDESLTVNLPAQTLQQSLIQLGQMAEISVVAPSYLLQGRQAGPIVGRMSAREALQRLIEDMPLALQVVNERVVAIVHHPEQGGIEAPTRLHEEMIVIGQQVTGSLLLRTDLQGSSPVDIISRQELDTRGAQNVAEFLKYIPAVSGNSTSTAISNGGDGTATVTLRGLPANNTLVLLNGRRTTSDGLDSDSVDLNSLPSAAIERVEILKDGASAIYGTDAIAGVVNIITKKDYQGLMLEQYYGTSYQGDTETSASHLMWGQANDRLALLISAQYYEQNGLFSRERELSSNADGRAYGGVDKRSTASGTTRVIIEEDERAAPVATTLSVTDSGFRSATDDDRFNYLAQTSSISPSRRENLLLSAQFSLDERTQLDTTFIHNATEATITFASVPLFTAFENQPITVAASNIYNPFGRDLYDVRRRIVELPPREQTNSTHTQRLALSLDGDHADTQWQLNAHWNQTHAREHATQVIAESHVVRALGPASACQGSAIDGCEPLNLFGPPGSISAAQLDYIRAENESAGNTRLYGLSANATRHLAELPGGLLPLALGVEWRKESVDSRPVGPFAGENTIGSLTRSATIGDRQVAEAFAESHVPLLKHRPFIDSLDLELAARYSHYSDFGDNLSPKFGLRLRPVRDLLLRATYSEGFRAPSLGELYTGSFQSQLPLSDPCAEAENVGVLPGCTMQSDDERNQFLTTFAGEPHLKPETSTSHTFGLVWTPALGGDFYLSLDHFSIRQHNIATANAQLILDRNAQYGDFSDYVQRDQNGNITRVYAPFINVGRRDISGFDTTLRWRHTLDGGGSFTYSLNASYLNEYRYQVDSESPYENLHGTFEDASREGSGALPRWKANTGILWQQKAVEFSYTFNHIASVREEIPYTNGETRELGEWNTHDAQLSFKLSRKNNTRLTFGVDNFFNESPPFSAAAFNDNYDARTYDIKGRFWYLKVVWEL